MGFVASVCHPSTLRMLIWPDASSAQNSMAAVSADGSTVCVLILRLNSSCSRSIALVVRTLRHWPGGSRVKANRRSPASSTLSATVKTDQLTKLAEELRSFQKELQTIKIQIPKESTLGWLSYSSDMSPTIHRQRISDVLLSGGSNWVPRPPDETEKENGQYACAAHRRANSPSQPRVAETIGPSETLRSVVHNLDGDCNHPTRR